MAKENVSVGSWAWKGQQHPHSLWGNVRLLVFPSPRTHLPPAALGRDGKCPWRLWLEWRREGTVLQDWPLKLAPCHLVSHGSFQPSQSCLLTGNLFGVLCMSPWGEIAQAIGMWSGENRTGLWARTSNVVLTLSPGNLGKWFWVSF